MASAVRLYAVSWVLWLRRRVKRRPGRSFRLRLRLAGTSVSVRITDYNDLLVMAEILLDDSYRLPDGLRPEVIFDVGANVGLSVLYFATRYPGARIAAFEPNPAAFAILRENTAAWKNIEIYNIALADTEGVRPFYPAQATFLSSLIPSSCACARIMVQTRTVDSVRRALGVERINCLKLDIEGGEWELLGRPHWLAHVDALVGELHFIGARLASLSAALGQFDYGLTQVGSDHAIISAVRRAPSPAVSS